MWLLIDYKNYENSYCIESYDNSSYNIVFYDIVSNDIVLCEMIQLFIILYNIILYNLYDENCIILYDTLSFLLHNIKPYDTKSIHIIQYYLDKQN